MKHVSLLIPSWKRKERSPDSRGTSPYDSPVASPRGGSFPATGSWQDLGEAAQHKSPLGALGVKRTRSKGSSSASYLDMDGGRRSLRSSTSGFRSLRSSKSVAFMSPPRPAPPPPLYPLSTPDVPHSPARPPLHTSHSAPPMATSGYDLGPIEVDVPDAPHPVECLSLEPTRGSSTYCTAELDCIWGGFLREMEEEQHSIDPACPSRSRARDALSPPPVFRGSQREAPLPRHCRLFTSSECSFTAPERHHSLRAPSPQKALAVPLAGDRKSAGEGSDSDDDCDSIIDPLLCFPSPPPLRIRKRLPTPIIVPSSTTPSLSSSSPSSSPTSDDTPIGTPTTPRAPHPYAIAQMYSANVYKSQDDQGSGDDIHDIFSMYSPASPGMYPSELGERAANDLDLRSCLVPPRSPSQQRMDIRAHVGSAECATETRRSYLSSMGRQAPLRSQTIAEETVPAVSWGVAV